MAEEYALPTALRRAREDDGDHITAASFSGEALAEADLSRLELREAENLMDKFDWQSMSEYYVRQLHCSRMMPKSDAEALLINSGFSYLEKVIRYSFS